MATPARRDRDRGPFPTQSLVCHPATLLRLLLFSAAVFAQSPPAPTLTPPPRTMASQVPLADGASARASRHGAVSSQTTATTTASVSVNLPSSTVVGLGLGFVAAALCVTVLTVVVRVVQVKMAVRRAHRRGENVTFRQLWSEWGGWWGMLFTQDNDLAGRIRVKVKHVPRPEMWEVEVKLDKDGEGEGEGEGVGRGKDAFDDQEDQPLGAGLRGKDKLALAVLILMPSPPPPPPRSLPPPPLPPPRRSPSPTQEESQLEERGSQTELERPDPECDVRDQRHPRDPNAGGPDDTNGPNETSSPHPNVPRDTQGPAHAPTLAPGPGGDRDAHHREPHPEPEPEPEPEAEQDLPELMLGTCLCPSPGLSSLDIVPHDRDKEMAQIIHVEVLPAWEAQQEAHRHGHGDGHVRGHSFGSGIAAPGDALGAGPARPPWIGWGGMGMRP